MTKNALWVFAISSTTLVVLLPSFAKIQELRAKDADYQQKLVELKVKSARLLEEKRLLQDDPVYLEKVAREKMGLAREGEMVYRITPAVEDKKKR